MPPQNTNKTLFNGMRLLEHLAADAGSHGVVELAIAMSLPQSHVHRLLQTLVQLGYVERNAKRRYKISPRVFGLSASLAENLPLRRFGGAHLRRLTDASAGDAFLLTWHDNAPMIVMADYFQGRRRADKHVLGNTLSIEGTASGRLFTAVRAEGTAGDCDDYQRIRKQGYAERVMAPADPTWAVAAIVRDAEDIVAVLGLSCSANGLDGHRRESHIRLVCEQAESLSMAMGWQAIFD